MVDPDRASRLWLAISLALLWLASIGTPGDDAYSSTSFISTDGFSPLTHPAHSSRRRLNIFRRGWIDLIVALIKGDTPFLLPLIPEPLPAFRQVIFFDVNLWFLLT